MVTGGGAGGGGGGGEGDGEGGGGSGGGEGGGGEGGEIQSLSLQAFSHPVQVGSGCFVVIWSLGDKTTAVALTAAFPLFICLFIYFKIKATF